MIYREKITNNKDAIALLISIIALTITLFIYNLSQYFKLANHGKMGAYRVQPW